MGELQIFRALQQQTNDLIDKARNSPDGVMVDHIYLARVAGTIAALTKILERLGE